MFGAGVISDTEEEGAWQCRDGSQAHRHEGVERLVRREEGGGRI